MIVQWTWFLQHVRMYEVQQGFDSMANPLLSMGQLREPLTRYFCPFLPSTAPARPQMKYNAIQTQQVAAQAEYNCPS